MLNHLNKTPYTPYQKHHFSFFTQAQYLDFSNISSPRSSDSNQNPWLTSHLICKNLDSNELKEGLFAIKQNFLVCFEKGNVNLAPTKTLNLHYALLLTKSSNLQHKFILQDTQSHIELTFYDERVFHSWLAEAKKFCVLKNFHEKYEIIEITEKGANHNICRIKSKKQKNSYTCKSYQKNQLQSSLTKKLLLNEIEIMRALSHQNIAELIEVFETDDAIHLVTEYIHDKTLEIMLKDPEHLYSLSPTSFQKILFSLLQTVSYLESKGVVHCNICPANILIQDQQKTKLINFGSAIFKKSPQQSFIMRGTPGYIAPEMINSEDPSAKIRKYNYSCDIFSVGCVFFEMLFGRKLFKGTHQQEILSSNKTGIQKIQQMILKEISDEANLTRRQGLGLLSQLLEQDPEKRISATEALDHPYFKSRNSLLLSLPAKKLIETPIQSKNLIKKIPFLPLMTESFKKLQEDSQSQRKTKDSPTEISSEDNDDSPSSNSRIAQEKKKKSSYLSCFSNRKVSFQVSQISRENSSQTEFSPHSSLELEESCHENDHTSNNFEVPFLPKLSQKSCTKKLFVIQNFSRAQSERDEVAHTPICNGYTGVNPLLSRITTRHPIKLNSLY